jgi:hypothetical protein
MGLKAKILVHLMGTLKLFFEFLNEPLQWCDVDFSNLGLSASMPKRFVVLDAGMLSFGILLLSIACRHALHRI